MCHMLDMQKIHYLDTSVLTVFLEESKEAMYFAKFKSEIPMSSQEMGEESGNIL